jgi:hypothetical protein
VIVEPNGHLASQEQKLLLEQIKQIVGKRGKNRFTCISLKCVDAHRDRGALEGNRKLSRESLENIFRQLFAAIDLCAAARLRGAALIDHSVRIQTMGKRSFG